MNEQQIKEKLEQAKSLCDSMEALLGVAQRQGRMMSIEEARRFDALSAELQQCIKAMPENPCAKMSTPEMQAAAFFEFQQIQTKLKVMLEQYISPSKTPKKARATAASRVKAYSAC